MSSSTSSFFSDSGTSARFMALILKGSSSIEAGIFWLSGIAAAVVPVAWPDQVPPDPVAPPQRLVEAGFALKVEFVDVPQVEPPAPPPPNIPPAPPVPVPVDAAAPHNEEVSVVPVVPNVPAASTGTGTGGAGGIFGGGGAGGSTWGTSTNSTFNANPASTSLWGGATGSGGTWSGQATGTTAAAIPDSQKMPASIDDDPFKINAMKRADVPESEKKEEVDDDIPKTPKTPYSPTQRKMYYSMARRRRKKITPRAYKSKLNFIDSVLGTDTSPPNEFNSRLKLRVEDKELADYLPDDATLLKQKIPPIIHISDDSNDEVDDDEADSSFTIVKPTPQRKRSFAPTLSDSSYYTYPPMKQLHSMTEEQLSQVQDLVVGRTGSGWVKFLGKTDVRNLNLDNIVLLENKVIELYPNEDPPPRGSGLNKAAIVCLEQCYPKSGKKSKQAELDRYRDKLHEILLDDERVTHDENGDFDHFAYDRGNWEFKVNYFV
eukprot:TRINITY_DN10285_c0_g1_i1.p1 TRINITY_DN10285_c0_g1~~TRINITY_DN10285_c0_g1_i1.p1  ORF type:complete len:489 (+),score=104.08 TRINITY_DN10285_c0_g1_i1:835-2301(+)